MNRQTFRFMPICALLAGASVPLAQAGIPASSQCPSPGFPAHSQVQVVTARSRVDGLPMLILQLQSPLTGRALLHWYDQRWRGTGHIPRALLYQAGAWMVVAHKTAGCFETLQVPGKSLRAIPRHAYLAVSRFHHQRAMTTHFPMPGGSRLLLTLENQGPAQARNLLLHSPESPRQTARFYRKTLIHDGWALQMSQTRPAGSALMFQKGARQAEIALNPAAGGSDVFVTFVHG